MFPGGDATSPDADGAFVFPLGRDVSGPFTLRSTVGRTPLHVAGSLLDEPPAFLQAEPIELEIHRTDRRVETALRIVATTTLEGRIESRCPAVTEAGLFVWAEPSEPELLRRAGLVAPHAETITEAGGSFRIEGIHPEVAYDLFVREARMAPYLLVERGHEDRQRIELDEAGSDGTADECTAGLASELPTTHVRAAAPAPAARATGAATRRPRP